MTWTSTSTGLPARICGRMAHEPGQTRRRTGIELEQKRSRYRPDLQAHRAGTKRGRTVPNSRGSAFRRGGAVRTTCCCGCSSCCQVRRQGHPQCRQGRVDRHQVSAWPMRQHRGTHHREPQPHGHPGCGCRSGCCQAPDDAASGQGGPSNLVLGAPGFQWRRGSPAAAGP